MKYWIFSMVFLTFVSENNRAKVYFKGKKISNDSRHTLTNREGESQCSTHRKLNQETGSTHSSDFNLLCDLIQIAIPLYISGFPHYKIGILPSSVHALLRIRLAHIYENTLQMLSIHKVQKDLCT